MIFQNIIKSKVNNCVNQIQSDPPILNIIKISEKFRFYGVSHQSAVNLINNLILENTCYCVQNESRMTLD